VAELAITFDDGPDPASTPALLDALAEGGARATFFVIAPRAAAHPALIARAVAEGHSVQLHCDRHVRHSHRSPFWVARDTRRALRTLARLGVTPTLWRTPWGVMRPWTRAIARRHGLRLVGWDVDTHDWRGDDASEMFAATRADLQPGATVLAHDGIGPGARRAAATETITYTRLVMGEAAARGLRLKALQ
jgi:peptidoglycan/xylan/chitin deacetylase (PgdA/CDA1 family)